MVDINRFHTGVSYLKIRPGEYQSDCYLTKPYKYGYSLIESYESKIQDDGSLTTTKGYDHPGYGIDEAYLYQLIDETYSYGLTPYISFVFTNIMERTLTQAQVSNFIARLGAYLGTRGMILDIMREWNRAGPSNLQTDDQILNPYFAFFRNAIDSQGFKGQILLSSHPVLPHSPEMIADHSLAWWLSSPSGEDVREGQLLCDVYGLSCYTNYPEWCMNLAEEYMNWIGIKKPIFFPEWSRGLDLGGALPEDQRANAAFIELCYSLLPSFPEVKMLGWWYPILYKTYDGGAACAKLREMSVKWDGYTPISPRGWLLPVGVGTLLLLKGRKSKRRG